MESFNQSSCLVLENLDSVILPLLRSPWTIYFIFYYYYPSLRLLFSPSSYHIIIFSFFSPPPLPPSTSVLSSRPKTHHAVPPSPASFHAIVLSIFCGQGFMCSRPPPPRSHQKRCLLSLSPPPVLSSPSLQQSGCPLQLKTRAHKPVLTTLCSSPERFIINRLKYSHCRALFWPVAPVSNKLREAYCPTQHSIYQPQITNFRTRRNLGEWLAISIQASAGRLRMIRLI